MFKVHVYFCCKQAALLNSIKSHYSNESLIAMTVAQ